MSAAALLAVVLSAAASVKVGAPGWNVSRIDPVVGQALELRFSNALGAEGISVITAHDISQMLAQERQRQLLGCADESACMVELAGALGVDALVSGVLTKQGSGYLVELRVIRADSGAVIDARSARPRTAEALQAWLDSSALPMARLLADALNRQLTPLVSKSSSRSATLLPWVPIAVGALAAIAGGICFGLSKKDAATLREAGMGHPLSDSDAALVAHRGQSLEGAGLGLLISGFVALAAGFIWLALAPSSNDEPAPLSLLLSGAGVGAASTR